MLHYSIYIKFQKRQNYSERKQIGGAWMAEAGDEGERIDDIRAGENFSR